MTFSSVPIFFTTVITKQSSIKRCFLVHRESASAPFTRGEMNFDIKRICDTDVGSLYAGRDDFSLITPDFPTDFTVLYDNQEKARAGSFDDVFLYKEYLCGSNLSSNATLTYCGRDTGEVVITNHLSSNNKKIIQLRDSYSRCLSPFLAQTCSQLRVMDLRYYRTMTFLDYIDQNRPDLVLITLCPDICDMTFSFDEIPESVYKK